MHGCINPAKELSMHDILIGLAYFGMVVGPAVLATFQGLQAGEDT
jgi:hypothetical protein